jgi:hypothetical protein
MGYVERLPFQWLTSQEWWGGRQPGKPGLALSDQKFYNGLTGTALFQTAVLACSCRYSYVWSAVSLGFCFIVKACKL